MRVRVVSDPDDLAELAATTIAGLLAHRSRDRVDLALAGGSTPRATYNRLIEEDVDWSRVDAWLSDERWVAQDHPECNGRMVMETLLAKGPARLHRPEIAPDLTPADSAERYEAVLRRILPEENGRVRSHLVLLGMGDDGHTASLFPGCDALAEWERLYVATYIPAKDSWRLTATLPLLQAARHLLFLVAGTSKAEAVAEVLEGPGPPLPARLVAEGAEDVTFLLDGAAAERLHSIRVEHI